MRNYWEQLSDRDRLMLSIGGIICVIYLFYLLVYCPLTTAVESKSQQWVEKTETLDWMKKIQSQGINKVSKMKTDNLLSLFSSQLKQSPVAHFHYELQQMAENRVQLTFDQVPFVSFISWFRKLNQTYSMEVVEFMIEHTPTPGLVKLKVVVGQQ